MYLCMYVCMYVFMYVWAAVAIEPALALAEA